MANTVITNKNMWPYYSAQNTDLNSTKTKDLDKDAFLKILMTQLQNQDPTQPMDDRAFIAQMAQFTSLEQLTKISDQLGVMSQSLGTASNLIGKNASWYNFDSKGEVILENGIVDSVTAYNGQTYVNVGDKSILVQDLVKIEDASTTTPSEDDGDA